MILFAHSYGAFVVPNYLALKPNIADKIVIMAGRLNMDEKIWNSFSEGKLKLFEEDGITVKEGIGMEEIMFQLFLSKKISNKMAVKNKMAAGIGHKRFTKLLKTKDLSDVLYVYGVKDQSVGRLKKEEIYFLEDNNVEYIKLEGGHGSMFDEKPIAEISHFIQKK